MRVLTVDPGMRNLAWAVTFDDFTYKTGVISIDKGSPEQMVAKTRKFFLALIFRYEPELIAMERYMTRKHEKRMRDRDKLVA